MLRYAIGMALAALCLGFASRESSAQSTQRCVEARVGGVVAYDCLNDAWRALAEQAHTPLAMNTLTARSSAPQVGTFNRSATAERMGNSFGHSVISQRPPPPVYANPVLMPR
jgi:hypothetical protein